MIKLQGVLALAAWIITISGQKALAHSNSTCSAVGVASVVSCGGYHTCAIVITTNGSGVKCWGYNQYAQLGLGDRANRGGQGEEMGNNLTFSKLVDMGVGEVPVDIKASIYSTCVLVRTISISKDALT